jgi:hypothetical protein
MSLVKANTYQDASGGSNAVFSGVASPPNSMGFRNRLLNSDMRIDQRNAGASLTITTTGGGQYTLDRWFGQASQSSKFSVQRNAGSVTPPAGFTNYLGVTSLSAYSVTSGDYFSIKQSIEGFNGADLAFGTANAATVTISFRVYSSLTGTFGGVLQNGSFNRSYPFTYTISAANTWTTISVTIPGDTSGTWATDNSAGLVVIFGLGVGSSFSGTAGSWQGANLISATGATSVVGTNGATFYITGVQLEAGTVASPFERRDYGRELMMCQRYYWKISTATSAVGAGVCNNATAANIYVKYPVAMRAAPTFSQSSTYVNIGSASVAVTSVVSAYASTDAALVQAGVASGLTANQGAIWIINSGYFDASIEL